jgi:general secretion pathway protein G
MYGILQVLTGGEDMKRKKTRKTYVSGLIRSWQNRFALLKKTSREAGATFMEVLVTIAIIAILMTTIGLAVVPFIAKSQESVAESNIETFKTALTAYYTMNFEYPDDTEWKTAIQPFLEVDAIPLDPWGNEYIYEKPGPNDLSYGIYSKGPDGTEGNDDDITSWTTTQ